MKKDAIFEKINRAAQELGKNNAGSAWDRGVFYYAFELLESYAEIVQYNTDATFCEATLLNGAANWLQYAEGGCGLCYNSAIAERLCNPTELKRTQGGKKQPNSRETWLQVEARALSQAWRMLRDAWAAAE